MAKKNLMNGGFELNLEDGNIKASGYLEITKDGVNTIGNFFNGIIQAINSKSNTEVINYKDKEDSSDDSDEDDEEKDVTDLIK